MKYSKAQQKRFNLYYEEKYKKFYYKFLVHPGNIKDRLLDCFDHFEYAYTLSQSTGVPDETKIFWQKMWDDLLAKPVHSEYRPLYFSFQNTIHRKHFKSFEKYIIFFFNEYERITS